MALPIIIAVVAVFIGFMIWLHFSVQRIQKHQFQTLGQSLCPECGTPYGQAVAERAREDYVARCLEARRQRPDLRINFVRFWEIRCAQCGAEARFHYETENLVRHAA